ncbi:hypothetical protein AN640_00745 [Candidatus Epulonipiscium fishelsonii]|uniref:Uncharacterized protein n=1 Tax=Candidatus Epulonipiscium fishelsonii TaxID=77094 RepID=A0ACC8XJ76_9FIRM|nr:hypothetical protein AN640_00745 [Epulopiscium sp. SCG-D08WGA-EpuloA1]OON91230.1 MAG: hypothetical protein ATN32_00280 [Epulopiscium sp. AS2M-Bin002]
MKITIKQIFPSILILISLFFIYEGIVKIGFWDGDNGPMGGFYPTIIAIILLIGSVISLMQSLKESEVKFFRDDFKVIFAGAAIIACSMLIGLIPSIAIYLVIWMRIIEKISWKSTLIFAGITTVIVYLVFGVWLAIQFPMGLFENFL